MSKYAKNGSLILMCFVSGLLGSLIGNNLISKAVAAENQPIKTSDVQLIDSSGKMRARLFIDANGLPVLKFFSKNTRPSVVLGLTDLPVDLSYAKSLDDRECPIIQLSSGKYNFSAYMGEFGCNVSANETLTKESAQIVLDKELGPKAWIWDKNGNDIWSVSSINKKNE